MTTRTAPPTPIPTPAAAPWGGRDGRERLRRAVAEELGVSAGVIDEQSGYGRPAKWDSLGHVAILLRCEREWGVRIDPLAGASLTSIAALNRFFSGGAGSACAPEVHAQGPACGARVHLGLRGVIVDETAISRVDADGSDLLYRGRRIGDLCTGPLEDAVSLLLSAEGAGPAREARVDWLARVRGASSLVEGLPLESVRGHALGDRLAAMLPMLKAGLAGRGGGDELQEAYAAIVALYLSLLGRPGHARGTEGSTLACEIARAVWGRELDGPALRAVEVCLIAQAEHGANASAFAARVASSAGASTLDAVLAALATFGGPKHGGALRDACDLLDALERPEAAHDFIGHLARAGQAIPGFGHRVYRLHDPRAAPLMAALTSLPTPEARDVRARLEAILAAAADLTRLGLVANVDLYAAALLRALGLDRERAYSLFVIARVPGWLAHIREQRERDVLIRPELRYVGAVPERPT